VDISGLELCSMERTGISNTEPSDCVRTKLVVVVHVDGVRRCLNCGHQRAYCSLPRCYMSVDSHGGMILTGETEALGENSPSATLSTTNLIWTDPSTNPGLRGEIPATNRLWHG
jgi:hypothetical protein